MPTPKTMNVHLDEDCVHALEQLKRQIDALAPQGMPVFTLQALARHAIRKWCDHVAAPVPAPGSEQLHQEG